MYHTAIRKIKVIGLFGKYNYDIPSSTDATDIENMMILYGDNGCGKTTILKMIYHLLGCSRNSGHKSFLVRTKFRSISIEFNNGCTVSAMRTGDSNIGSYLTMIKKGDGSEVIGEIIINSDGIAKGADENTINVINDTLSGFQLSYYFLSDDRRLYSDFPNTNNPLLNHRNMIESPENHRGRLTSKISSNDSIPDPEVVAIFLLEQSISRLTEIIRFNVMLSSSNGDSSVNGVYNDIISRLSTVISKRDSNINKQEIYNSLNAIEKTICNYSKYEFMPSFSADEIIKSLDHADTERTEAIVQVLRPFINSLNAKIDAMKDIYINVEYLINTLNVYLKDKSIRFSLSNGLNITTNDDQESITPSMLSSGERHLMLMFCNAITCLDKPSIYFIDEPEISLNIKWQRRLVSDLMKCAENAPTQYITATHSVEILSQHLNRVNKLENISNKSNAVTWKE